MTSEDFAKKAMLYLKHTFDGKPYRYEDRTGTLSFDEGAVCIIIRGELGGDDWSYCLAISGDEVKQNSDFYSLYSLIGARIANIELQMRFRNEDESRWS